MNQTHPTPQAQLADQIAAAVQAENLSEADRLLNQLGEAADLRIVIAVGSLCMRLCRWREAAAILGRIHDPDTDCRMKARLAENLLLLQEKRPGLYQILIETTPQTRCDLHSLHCGQFTIIQTLPGRTSMSLSQGADPRHEAQQAMPALNPTISKHEALLLAGIGDGYLLSRIADRLGGMEGDFLPIAYLVEPDPEVILNCMMIHDYTGHHGPIECENFRWFVGKQWPEQLREEIGDQPLFPDPARLNGLSLHGKPLMEEIQSIFSGRRDNEQQMIDEIEDYYGSISRQHLTDLLGPTPPRRPRLLVITSRFTTVLQYSSRDVVDAFKALGWETQLMIEPTPRHRITYAAVREQLHEFKPDIVFTIDHLRSELPGVYPPNLPYICWIQDNLPNLAAPQAGRTVTPRDFVLGPDRPIYTKQYGYPARQWIDMGKLTRLPRRPTSWTSDGDDLAYVSNASRQPEDIAQKLVAETSGHDKARAFMRCCCDRVIEAYQSGGCIETNHQIFELIGSVERDRGLSLGDYDTRFEITTRLTHPLNDALYRQQGLRWASRLSKQLGLTLAIYGDGWDEHPEFARHARGYVTYGEQLETLTRRAKINLRLEPLACLSHQRMTDGLVAGGFFLHRHYQPEAHLQTLGDFIHHHLAPSVETLPQARVEIAPAHRDQFEALVENCLSIYPEADFDPILGVRISQAEGAFAIPGEPLPRLSEITFRDEPTLRALIEKFIDHPALREKIAGGQRRAVEERLTYTAGMKRTIKHIRQLIADESTMADNREPSTSPVMKKIA